MERSWKTKLSSAPTAVQSNRLPRRILRLSLHPNKHPPPAYQSAPQNGAPQYAQQPAPAPNPQATQPVAKKVNGLGIAGFVVALLSLWLGVYFCIASIIGLTLSAVAMGLRKRYNSCNGLAIAGLVIGIISVVIWGIIWIAAASILAEFGMI